MLRHLPDSARQVLLDLLNASWLQQQLPKDWKHSKVVPILKPGKDPSKPDSYRPIAMTSCVCKLQERMIKDRLTWFLEKNNLINKSQSGFRAHRSTLDNIIILEDDIQSALQCGEYVLAVSLDMEKAFDLVWNNGLLVKLYRLGIRGNMFGWIRSYLTNRSSHVEANGARSRIYLCPNGTPQGGVLSPDLFTAMTNDIATHKTICKSGKFADDEIRWLKMKNLHDLKEELEKDLTKSINDYKKWGFKIGAQKTKATIFTLRKIPADFSLQVSGERIVVGISVKILGITMDSKLRWKEHINSVEQRCSKTLHLLRRITGFNRGAKAPQLLMIYKALIRSKMEYGGSLFESASSSVKNQLDVIQSKALKICLGLPKATANATTFRESGEMPLDLRRNLSTVHNFFRLRSLPSPSLRLNSYGSFPASFSSRAANITMDCGTEANGIEKISYDNEPPWHQNYPALHITKQPMQSRITYNSFVSQEWTNWTQIFTDGAWAE